MSKNKYASIILIITVIILFGIFWYLKFNTSLSTLLTEQGSTNTNSQTQKTLPPKPTSSADTILVNTKQSSLGDCVLQPGTPGGLRKDQAASSARPESTYSDKISVKFQEGSDVRLRDGKFVSLCGADLTEMNNLILSDPTLHVERLFSSSSEEKLSSYKSGAALNLFFLIRMEGNTDYEKLRSLINALNSFDIVNIAYASPIPHDP